MVDNTCQRALETKIFNMEKEIDRLKNQIEQLALFERKYSKAFYNNQTPMVITRIKDGAILDVNDKYLDLLEYERQELIGKSVFDINCWGDINNRTNMINQINKNGYLKDFAAKFKTKSGKTGFILSSLSILELEGDQCLLVSSEDITERRKAEEALKVSEEKFSKAFHNNSVRMALARLEDALYTDVNDNCARALGYSREEIIGKNNEQLNIFVDSRDQTEMPRRLAEFGYVRDYEFQYRTRSGDIRTALNSIDILDINGVKHMLMSGVDITERKQAEEALVQSQSLLKQVFSNIPLPIIVVRISDGMVIEANDKFLDVYGKSREDLIGNCSLPVYRDQNNSDFEKYIELIKQDGLVRNYEMKLELPGQTMTVLLTGLVVDWNGDKCVLTIGNDITEIRKYHDELFRLDNLNLMGQMAASIAHEVRNPMTSVKGFLQLFQMQYKYREDRESIALMIEELDRINEIITAFLSLAKKNHIELKLNNLNTCVASTLPLIIADGIKNDVFVDPLLKYIPDIMVDEGEIRQLLLNLARNAIQAMPDGGTLTISTGSDDDGVNLVIQDQGAGIPLEVVDKIGTPFFTTKEGGSGLGLGVCYSIAERHSARITFDTSPAGTSFKVTFPTVNSMGGKTV